MTLGQRIRELREDKGITQEELGKIVNVSKASFSKYEADIIEPNKDTIIALANFFNVSTDYLLCKTDIRNIQEGQDPFGLEQLGFNIKDYVPPTPKQKEQIKEIIETILKYNKKDKSQ